MCPTRTWRKEIDIVENKKIQLKKNTHILQITPPGLSYRFLYICTLKTPQLLTSQLDMHRYLALPASLSPSHTHSHRRGVCTVQGPGSGSGLSCYSRPRPLAQALPPARRRSQEGTRTWTSDTCCGAMTAERETEQPIPLFPSGHHGNYIHPLFTPVLQKRSARTSNPS